MYLRFFGLKEYPFSLTPDPKYFFFSRSHREAFDHLWFGIDQRKGFIEVVGGIGTGKTTLCRGFLEELEGKVSTALIFNTFLSEIELLKSINDEFGVDSSGSTRKALIDALNAFLIDRLARGGNACLIIDECQNLGPSVLEQIRMLSNLETETEKLLQIVLVGQPEFHVMLKSRRLRQLDERIQVRAFLKPLDEQETRAYISHRLTVAGSRGDIVFTEGALSGIYAYSRGIPRRINTVCDRCLLIAYARDTFRIDREHARSAIAEIQEGPDRKRIRIWLGLGKTRPRPRWASLVLLGALGLMLGWLFGQTLLFHVQRADWAEKSFGAPAIAGVSTMGELQVPGGVKGIGEAGSPDTEAGSAASREGRAGDRDFSGRLSSARGAVERLKSR